AAHHAEHDSAAAGDRARARRRAVRRVQLARRGVLRRPGDGRPVVAAELLVEPALVPPVAWQPDQRPARTAVLRPRGDRDGLARFEDASPRRTGRETHAAGAAAGEPGPSLSS